MVELGVHDHPAQAPASLARSASPSTSGKLKWSSPSAWAGGV
jgi:hypothetical protein